MFYQVLSGASLVGQRITKRVLVEAATRFPRKDYLYLLHMEVHVSLGTAATELSQRLAGVCKRAICCRRLEMHITITLARMRNCSVCILIHRKLSGGKNETSSPFAYNVDSLCIGDKLHLRCCSWIEKFGQTAILQTLEIRKLPEGHFRFCPLKNVERDLCAEHVAWFR